MEKWPLRERRSLAYVLLMFMMITVSNFMAGEAERGCFEEERMALLEIKESMRVYGDDVDHLLPTWDGDESCCDWERVTCNTTSGRVTELSFYHIHDPMDLYDQDKGWTLNISVFLHFKELASLNLSWCSLVIEYRGLERLSSLKNLETLGLSGNLIDVNIFRGLCALTSLRILDLGEIRMSDGSFPAQGLERLSSLKNLETLDLSWNLIDINIFRWLGAITNLKILDLSGNRMEGYFPSEELTALENLETLNLGFNDFNESIIASLSHLPSLKALDLSWNGINGSFPSQELTALENLETLNLMGNHFNESNIASLSHLPSLKALDLSDNRMFGSFPTQELIALKNLETLNLGGNLFNESIMASLSHLPSLKTLDLSYNEMSGSFPTQGFASLQQLESLDLSSNNLVGAIPSSIWALSSLRFLSLASNNLTGPLNGHGLTSLQVLSLAQNNLNGSLINYGFCELKNLIELDLSENMLEGNLSHCLNNLSSLKLLDISSNQFTGKLPPSLMANLKSLEYVDLSYNKFGGLLSFSTFSLHSKLEVVKLINDGDKFEVETEEPLGWIPMFQLKVLMLSNCNLNRLSKSVPSFLLHQHELRLLDLSHNSLDEQFPQWLIENNTKLEVLILRNNSLGGNLYMSAYGNGSIRWLDVSDNHLNGIIPLDIGELLPKVQYLNFSMNSLSGDLPSSIGDMFWLDVLDLSYNKLDGKVTDGLFANKYRLEILKLSNNNLQGEVLPKIFCNLRNLQVLLLDSNSFTGKIENCNNTVFLQRLDISNNLFSGMIPGWISNLPNLMTLVIQNNSFEGEFPCGTTPFRFLDISRNIFSGPILSCSNLQDVEHLHLGHNRFTGSISQSFRNLSKLLTLDVNNNTLSGRIPEYLGDLSNLRILLLSKNNFSGSIPKQLCRLSNMSIMSLSSNLLSGSIPHCLQNITGPFHNAFIQTSTTFDNMSYLTVLGENWWIDGPTIIEMQDQFEFVTKGRPDTYKGSILNYMSGLDLSCNNLTGEIPKELGSLSQIHALNLSHNQLTGPIPAQFSNLTNVESMDLSSNRLIGSIPLELVKLTKLEVFTVANNNLSGSLPNFKAQFGTFGVNSYEGNPYLCGPPLMKKCTPDPLPNTIDSSVEEDVENWFDINMIFFVSSFTSTWLVVVLGFATAVYINSNRRRRWLYFVQECTYICYYFVCDSLCNLTCSV